MPAHRRQVSKWLELPEEGGLREDALGEEEQLEEEEQSKKDRSGAVEAGLHKKARTEEPASRSGRTTSPKSRVSRPSALRRGVSLGPRARGKGQAEVRSTGKDIPQERAEQKRDGIGEDLAWSEGQGLAEDLRLGSKGEREQMSTSERKKLDQVKARRSRQTVDWRPSQVLPSTTRSSRTP